MPSSQPKIINNCIALTKLEQEIFHILKNVAHETSGTIVRVAGGWVRDKLLGIESDDIDIAVNNMSGEEFAKKVTKYTENKNISIIKANPEQSKHLATAMLNVCGRNVDFANLRKENYADSRIPIIEPGAPFEDASRRDLTINSLFYNLNNSTIEDYVGGYDDLQKRIARTPINPNQTFLDDPLRILRTIRFAAKYNLSMSFEILNAGHVPEIQEALKTKVSPERIWKEMAGQGSKPGFLNGRNPVIALTFAWRMQLMPFLFDLKMPPPIVLVLSNYNYDPETILIRNLAAIWYNKTDRKTQILLKKLKAPTNIAKRVLKLKKHVDWSNKMTDAIFREKIVDVGCDWSSAADLSILINNQPPILKYRAKSLVGSMNGIVPKLPINGNDLKKLGIRPGSKMGRIFDKVTKAWFANPQLSKDAALQIAESVEKC